jgi:hypothetical protein
LSFKVEPKLDSIFDVISGRPAATRYIWRRGGHRVNYVDSYNWTISPVTLETEANISCVAVNQVGQGEPDFITIEVFGKF